MTETILAVLLTVGVLVLMLVWVPVVLAAEALARKYPVERGGEMPNLVEEDSGPQYTGKVA